MTQASLLILEGPDHSRQARFTASGRIGRGKVTMSDLYLYDLVHPLFLNSMGELGTENLVLSLFRKHPDLTDKERIEKGGVSKGTFYKYKKVLQGKGLI